MSAAEQHAVLDTVETQKTAILLILSKSLYNAITGRQSQAGRQAVEYKKKMPVSGQNDSLNKVAATSFNTCLTSVWTMQL